jgi:hypothetical protein
MIYNEVIEHLEQKLEYQPTFLFDFSTSPGREEYEKFFNFYQGNIERHYEYGFSNGYFFFIDKNEIDARARKIKSCYLIGISKEIVERFGRQFHTYFSVKEIPELNNYLDLEGKLKNSIGELMYHFILHFTFYHELGHLIQFINTGDLEKEESNTSDGIFNITDHIDELDADMFGSICISSHISNILKIFLKEYQLLVTI